MVLLKRRFLKLQLVLLPNSLEFLIPGCFYKTMVWSQNYKKYFVSKQALNAFLEIIDGFDCCWAKSALFNLGLLLCVTGIPCYVSFH
jgi:hypothetical protein